MKTCTTCGVPKPPEHFHKLGVRNGVQQYRSQCKLCRNEELRTKREDGRRLHFENAERKEWSPHPAGVLKFIGWGYAP